MPVATEQDPKSKPSTLVSSRKPVGVKDTSTKTIGVHAVNDSLIFVGACWLAVVLLWLSLRKSNV